MAKLLTIPIHVVGILSDALYPITEQKELAQLLPKGQFTALESPYGHDAFLIEFKQLIQIFTQFLAST